MTYYTKLELLAIGFNFIGENVLVHRTTQFYNITGFIMNNTRIDGPSIFTGHIEIGSFVHLGAFSRFAATDSYIKIGDYTGISSHCAIYSVTENFSTYSGFGNPTLAFDLQNPLSAGIIIEDHVMIGTGVILLPGSLLRSKSVISAGLTIRTEIKSNHLIFSDSSKLKSLNRSFLKKK